MGGSGGVLTRPQIIAPPTVIGRVSAGPEPVLASAAVAAYGWWNMTRPIRDGLSRFRRSPVWPARCSMAPGPPATAPPGRWPSSPIRTPPGWPPTSLNCRLPAAAGGRRSRSRPCPPSRRRRAYTEVLLVFGAFFLAGIVGAGLLLAGRYQNPLQNGSWSDYAPEVVDILAQIGLALAVVLLLERPSGGNRRHAGVDAARAAVMAVSRPARPPASWRGPSSPRSSAASSTRPCRPGTCPTSQPSAPELDLRGGRLDPGRGGGGAGRPGLRGRDPPPGRPGLVGGHLRGAGAAGLVPHLLRPGRGRHPGVGGALLLDLPPIPAA